MMRRKLSPVSSSAGSALVDPSGAGEFCLAPINDHEQQRQVDARLNRLWDTAWTVMTLSGFRFAQR